MVADDAVREAAQSLAAEGGARDSDLPPIGEVAAGQPIVAKCIAYFDLVAWELAGSAK